MLNLIPTAKKLYKAGFFSNISIKNNILHCSYGNWQFNFYKEGFLTATLPFSEKVLIPTFESDYHQLGEVDQTSWLHHQKYVTDNPDYCLRVALSYIF